jgi:hypothetical protein
MLPDIALLGIFDFYVELSIEAWQILVHVCRKWRDIVFGSPRRLNLRLYCGRGKPVREMLDIWPPLPIVIKAFASDTFYNMHNISVALEHTDRICELYFIALQASERFLAVIQKPFPLLTHLTLGFLTEPPPFDPDSFLGGSMPCLKSLCLRRIPFPGLPKLLLSATHLVDLDLDRIPDSGYVSPEAMVAGLSALTRLKTLAITAYSLRSRPERNSRPPSPQTRIHLPVLTDWRFRGVSEYLEDLVAQIDAPLLDKLAIIFLHQLTFDTPELTQFISRSPMFKTHDEAHVTFSIWEVSATLPKTLGGEIELGVTCNPRDWHLSSLARLCSLSFPRTFISAVERLYILENKKRGGEDHNTETGQWLELFHPFTAVKNLYLFSGFSPRIALALRELVGERVTEVLPALQTLFIEGTLRPGLVQESIGQFVATRKHAGYPIAISRWVRDADDG